MPQTIEIPNVGEVEFPDEMTDDQIRSVIKRKFFAASAPASPGVVDKVASVIGGPNVGPLGVPSNWSGMPEEQRKASWLPPLQTSPQGLRNALTSIGKVGLPGQRGMDVPVPAPYEPISEPEANALALPSAIVNLGGGVVNFLASPEGALMTGGMAAGPLTAVPALGVMAGDMAAASGEESVRYQEELKKPDNEFSFPNVAEAAVNTVGMGAGALGIGLGGVKAAREGYLGPNPEILTRQEYNRMMETPRNQQYAELPWKPAEAVTAPTLRMPERDPLTEALREAGVEQKPLVDQPPVPPGWGVPEVKPVVVPPEVKPVVPEVPKVAVEVKPVVPEVPVVPPAAPKAEFANRPIPAVWLKNSGLIPEVVTANSHIQAAGLVPTGYNGEVVRGWSLPNGMKFVEGEKDVWHKTHGPEGGEVVKPATEVKPVVPVKPPEPVRPKYNRTNSPEYAKALEETFIRHGKADGVLREMIQRGAFDDLPAQKAIAEHLAKFANETPINVVGKLDENPNAIAWYKAYNDVSGPAGLYFNKKKLGTTSIPKEQVFLHEYLHSVSARFIRENENHPLTQRMLNLANASYKIYAKQLDVFSVPYGYKNVIHGKNYNHKVAEFLSEAFANPEFQSILRKQRAPAWALKEGFKTAWDAFVDTVKKIIGIKGEKSMLEEVMKTGAEIIREDHLRQKRSQELTDLKPGEGEGSIFNQLPDLIEAERRPESRRIPKRFFEQQRSLMVDPISASGHAMTGSILTKILTSTKTSTSAFYNKRMGYTLPRHVAVDVEAANLLARYGASRPAAPEVAKWKVTDVLGSRWQDVEFDKKLATALYEDRLRGLKRSLLEKANAEKDPAIRAEFIEAFKRVTSVVHTMSSVFKGEKEYKAFLADPEVQAIIDRHKKTIQPEAEEAHIMLGKSIAGTSSSSGISVAGDRTGAFLNFLHQKNDPTGMLAASLVFDSRRGNLNNPRRKRSGFNMKFKGTGEEYVLSYRKTAENMIMKNYERAALHRYYDYLVKQGLATKDRSVKEIGGYGLREIDVTPKGRPGGVVPPSEYLRVREDLWPELENALNVEGRKTFPGLGLLLDVLTDFQVMGTTDLTAHMVNMFGVMSQMPTGRPIYDVLRKATPVGTFDAVLRTGMEFIRLAHETPEVQRLVAEYMAIGAGRGKPQHRGGIITKVGEKLGQDWSKRDYPSKVTEASSTFIKNVDRAGRVVLLKWYKELEKKGIVEPGEFAKREMLNTMGQYEGRLMGYWQRMARDATLSPFIVAGTRMNINARRRLMMSPLVKAANPKAWAMMRLSNMLSAMALLVIIPRVLNKALSGNSQGRPGTPWGQIDLGGEKREDGTHETFDPLQFNLLRRGLRNQGVQAFQRGMSEKMGGEETAKMMAADIVGGVLHPWVGPAPNTIWIAATGKEFGSGYLASRNPMEVAENIKAALWHINPQVEAYHKGKTEEGKSGMAAVGKAFLKPFGVKSSRRPSLTEVQEEMAQSRHGTAFEKLPMREKLLVSKDAIHQRKLMDKNEKAERSAGERTYWRGISRKDEAAEALPEQQKEWLKREGLSVEGYDPTLTIAGIKLNATREEREYMKKEIIKAYGSTIDQVMKIPGFNRFDRVKKQEILNRFLTRARKIARTKLLRYEVNGGEEGGPVGGPATRP